MPKSNCLAILSGIAPEKKGEMAEMMKGIGHKSPKGLEPEGDEGLSEQGGSYETELDLAVSDLMQAFQSGDKETAKLALHSAMKACIADEQD